MKKSHGFTLIELIIVTAIVGIIAAIVSSATNFDLFSGRTVCKAGFQFNVDVNGYQSQVFDENGPVRCN